MKRKNKILRDPVCGKKINKNKAYAKEIYGKNEYYLCCALCQSTFLKQPDKFIN